eukprot:COSAG06_NODE_4430_length_4274_cov_11.496648_2_plen_75_part_00
MRGRAEAVPSYMHVIMLSSQNLGLPTFFPHPVSQSGLDRWFHRQSSSGAGAFGLSLPTPTAVSDRRQRWCRLRS